MPSDQELLPLYQAHSYWHYPSRWELVNSWWKARRKPGMFSETVIPQTAVIVTADDVPACFLSASMDNSIGKAVLEGGITAPGQTASESRRCLQFAETAVFMALKANGYGLAETFTIPAIARTLERDGWIRVGDVVHLVKQIT